jgi:hypothetical protein
MDLETGLWLCRVFFCNLKNTASKQAWWFEEMW